jgi:hypothetical protein
MSDIDTEIREIADRITRLVRDAYRRGEADALERLVRLARSDSSQADGRAESALDSAPSTTRRRRAPKGAVEELVIRSLSNGAGKTPDQIKEQAESDDERMIARSTIRAHLRSGVTHGRYVKKGGRWYLASGSSRETEETGRTC